MSNRYQVDYITLPKTSKFILQLTVEDYVQTLEKLTSDMRFTIYVMLYKRILVIWIVLAFVILLSLLFSGFQNIELFACGVVWLILNAGAIFFCMWVKIKVSLITVFPRIVSTLEYFTPLNSFRSQDLLLLNSFFS